MAANRVCQRCNKLTNMFYVSRINKQRICHDCKVWEEDNKKKDKFEYVQTNWNEQKDNIS